MSLEEKRAVNKLGAYMDHIPALESAIVPDHLKDIWEHCFLLEKRQNGFLRYVFMGNNLINAENGKEIDRFAYQNLVKLDSMQLEKISAHFASSDHAINEEGEVHFSNDISIKYRAYYKEVKAADPEFNRLFFGTINWRAYFEPSNFNSL